MKTTLVHHLSVIAALRTRLISLTPMTPEQLRKAMRKTIVCALLLSLCSSCGRSSDDLRTNVKKEAAEIAHKVKDQAQAIPNVQQIKSDIERLIAAVNQKELQQLKDACDGVDVRLGTRILVKYHKAFSLEVTEGPPSVLAYLNTEINGLVDGDAEKTALTGLRKYFEAKGTLTTKDAAVLILLVALETKFPHGRGTCLVAPFMDLSKTEDSLKESPTNMTLIGASATNAMYTMSVELEFETGSSYKRPPFIYHFRPKPIARDTGETGTREVQMLPYSMSTASGGSRGGSQLSVAPQPPSEFPDDNFGLRVDYKRTVNERQTGWSEFVPLKLGQSSTGQVGVLNYRATWTTAPGAPPYRRPKQ